METSQTVIYNLCFDFRGIGHTISFTPEESDFWTSAESNGNIFDIHYDEEYGTISIYYVIEYAPGSFQVDVANTIAKFPINKPLFQ